VPQRIWDERIAKIGAEWLEPVRGSGTPTRARCLHCGRQRLAVPASVSAGAGCPCRSRQQQEAWDERIARIGAEWLEPVDCTATRITVRCLNCGHEWRPTPAEVIKGRGCPTCARRTSSAAVESQVQQDYLRRPGCDAEHGFGIGRAQTDDSITELLLTKPDPHEQPADAATAEALTSPVGSTWIPAPVGSDEPARLSALRALQVLDSGPEPEFDDIVGLVAEICETPLAFVSLVDAEREYFKAAVGTERREAPRDRSFCGHAIHARHLFVVDDALQDPRFAGNPNVVAGDRVRFYAGAPLVTPEGHAVGMLCVKDTRPRKLTATQRHTLAVLGRQLEAQLELRRVRIDGRRKLAPRRGPVQSRDRLAACDQRANSQVSPVQRLPPARGQPPH